jgi:tetratricopeptide (TPR) repeat protein
MFRSSLVVLALSICALPAQAGKTSAPTAIAAYRSGNYELAANISEQTGTAASYAFAAQALVADAISRKEGFCIPCLEKAERLAEHAIELDPRLIDGYLQDAVAIGFRGRGVGITEARAQGLAEKARAVLDKAIAIDPTNVWARASLGAWHIEIVHHAGRILASFTYGASRAEGLTLYRSALKDAPDVAVLHFHYALSILALDQAAFRQEAERELRHTLTIRTDDALTAFVRIEAEAVLGCMQSGSQADLDALVLKLQGYPADEP